MAATDSTTKTAPQAEEAPKLSRVQKLAALLVILGPDAAAQVLRAFEPQEVEDVCG